MCGRFTQTLAGEAIAQTFGVTTGLAKEANPQPRYNIAPTQAVSAIAQPEHAREYRLFQWGLVPSWAKDPSIGSRMINARSETVTEKPSFRTAFKRRRCLIVADGFYEWQRTGKAKQPYYIQLKSRALFGFAGLWEAWESGDGSYLETCTILTTEPNELMRPIHNRMPVIVHPEDYDLWLNPHLPKRAQDSAQIQNLLRPYEANAMQAYPVSTVVNAPSHETPECIKPIESSEPVEPVPSQTLTSNSL
jgi:putative SOS response-associated peptidase YedK